MRNIFIPRSCFRENTMLITLFLTFAKIGLFTFGGGYAMLSVIEHTCITQKQWITHDDLSHVTVIAESTPGPIAINCATFIGYRQKGFLGDPSLFCHYFHDLAVSGPVPEDCLGCQRL